MLLPILGQSVVRGAGLKRISIQRGLWQNRDERRGLGLNGCRNRKKKVGSDSDAWQRWFILKAHLVGFSHSKGIGNGFHLDRFCLIFCTFNFTSHQILFFEAFAPPPRQRREVWTVCYVLFLDVSACSDFVIYWVLFLSLVLFLVLVGCLFFFVFVVFVPILAWLLLSLSL